MATSPYIDIITGLFKDEVAMLDAKKVYYITTALLSLMMLGSAGMYFFNHSEVSGVFTSLGYPTYIIYPLGVLKILGIIVIWLRKSRILRELAYAGFFYDFVLAFFAHIMVNDGEWFGALLAMIILLISYGSQHKAYGDS